MSLIRAVATLAALLTLAECVPIDRSDVANNGSELLNYESVHGREMYSFKYETSDGQFREEVGMLVNEGTPALMLMGQYGYKSKDGTMVMVMYTSGKKGYRARTGREHAERTRIGQIRTGKVHPLRAEAVLVRHVLHLLTPSGPVYLYQPVTTSDPVLGFTSIDSSRHWPSFVLYLKDASNGLRSIVAAAILLSVVSVLAAPARYLNPDLVYYENTRDENGYSFTYKTKDGQYREEQGHIDPADGILRVTGLYRYEGTDGQTYEYNYEADENGYRIVTKPPPAGAPISNTVLLSLVG
uniref:Uncharacterized protein n=1 Tax=Anopheles dirus TaxID=7168 RepID=A0A182NII3_9DIPT